LPEAAPWFGAAEQLRQITAPEERTEHELFSENGMGDSNQRRQQTTSQQEHVHWVSPLFSVSCP
jgi:hypothetical protein